MANNRPYTRTGRGAALLQALEQQNVRRPGELPPQSLGQQQQPSLLGQPASLLGRHPVQQPPPSPPVTVQQQQRSSSLLSQPPTPQPTVHHQPPHQTPPPSLMSPESRNVPPTQPSPPQSLQQAPLPPAAAAQSTAVTRPKPMGRGVLLRQLYESQTTRMPSSQTTAPLSEQMSQLHVRSTAPALDSQRATPTGLQGRTPTPDSSMGVVTRSSPSPAAHVSPVATKHSPPSTAAPSRSPPGPTKLRSSPTYAEPMKGTSGQSIPVGANYLVVKSRTENVYQYVVNFSPPVESRNMRYAMLNEHRDLIGPTRAFDGTTLYLPINITDTTVSRTSKRATDGMDITLSITLTNVIEYRECTQLFNIIIRRVLKALDLQQVGRHYFDKHHPVQVPQHKMELWPGYVTAIHQFDGGLLLLLDVSHKLLRMDTALDFFYELYSSSQNNFQEEATRQIVGSIVLTRYNNKTYRVDDIAWDKNPQSTFIDHTGRAISFVEYYKTSYGREISDIEQPLLLHRPKRRRMPVTKGRGNANIDLEEEPEQVICLVPELCSMTGLTDKARNDFRVMKDLAVHTRLTPNQREVAIKKFVRAVNESEKAKEELASWGLTLVPSILETTGRLMKPEMILFKDTSTAAGLEADWSRQLVKEHVISSVPLSNWLLVVTKRDSNKALDFMTMMKKVCPPMGIEVKDAKVVELPNDRTEQYVRAIRDQIKSTLQLVVIIFPTPRDDRYASVKKLCCIESPVPSQVINAKTISQQQKLRSVTQKIALQINVKLGGELWAVKTPLDNTMVIGIDVYHDSTRGRRSVLGFVSSTNKHFTRWYSRVSIQDANQEIGDGLKVCFQASLRKYHSINANLPDRIIVFRDGVGDGQLATVLEFEIPQFKSCLEMFGESYKPKMGFVIVQKRISTRIFAFGSNGYDNPSPGTVLDHTITRRGWYDFFLVSQHVRQGTVTPTHYNILSDDSGLKPDHMQKFTYKLTHMYYNWPGTIRVPAPCQYAHKLAFLVGQSLHREPSQDISDRLFFL